MKKLLSLFLLFNLAFAVETQDQRFSENDFFYFSGYFIELSKLLESNVELSILGLGCDEAVVLSAEETKTSICGDIFNITLHRIEYENGVAVLTATRGDSRNILEKETIVENLQLLEIIENQAIIYDETLDETLTIELGQTLEFNRPNNEGLEYSYEITYNEFSEEVPGLGKFTYIKRFVENLPAPLYVPEKFTVVEGSSIGIDDVVATVKSISESEISIEFSSDEFTSTENISEGERLFTFWRFWADVLEISDGSQAIMVFDSVTKYSETERILSSELKVEEITPRYMIISINNFEHTINNREILQYESRGNPYTLYLENIVYDPYHKVRANFTIVKELEVSELEMQVPEETQTQEEIPIGYTGYKHLCAEITLEEESLVVAQFDFESITDEFERYFMYSYDCAERLDERVYLSSGCNDDGCGQGKYCNMGTAVNEFGRTIEMVLGEGTHKICGWPSSIEGYVWSGGLSLSIDESYKPINDEEQNQEIEQENEQTEVVTQTEPQEESVETVKECISGCEYEGVCYEIGNRQTVERYDVFCDGTKEWKIQRDDLETCNNNYECKSNFCSNNQCYDIVKEVEETRNFFQKLIDFIKAIFGMN